MKVKADRAGLRRRRRGQTTFPSIQNRRARTEPEGRGGAADTQIRGSPSSTWCSGVPRGARRGIVVDALPWPMLSTGYTFGHAVVGTVVGGGPVGAGRSSPLHPSPGLRAKVSG